MKDYRLPENRREYFDALYQMNLQYGIMPGLVYLYMPKLAEHFGWDDEQKLWFAVINGCTQNSITSLRIFNHSPEIPSRPAEWRLLDEWFNTEWPELQFDTDRRHQKKETVRALYSYSKLASEHGSQSRLWSGKSFAQYWDLADKIYSFGRLSKFSYLEYVTIMGFGADCDTMFFNDKSGSKSHRNGMFFLLGHDDLVWDKRHPNSHSGEYEEFGKICNWLEAKADEFLKDFHTRGYPHPYAGKFTLESQLCQFKNGFFKRRFPGVYADMAHERIEWYDERGFQKETEVFKAIRSAHLPDWLRIETEKKPIPRARRAAQFAETGFPYRGENFL